VPPPRIPDYEPLRRIGRGSYGEVWLARNVLGQLRAVKVVYRSRFTDPRPFEREFEGIQRFEPISRSHPSQLHILHVGKNDAEGCFYYVMELADAAGPPRVESRRELRVERGGKEASLAHPMGEGRGEGENTQPSTLDPLNYFPRTLRSDLERHGRLPSSDCVQIGLSLATALGHLHEQALVHRDIKPSNVLFVNGVAKLGDIGLVTEAGDTQSIVGTEGYLPPEGPGTPQADLYSLGKVLYEMSTGLDRRRFPKLPEDLPSWPDYRAVMEFNEIVLRACAKDSAQRYQTAEQLRADLALLQEGKSVRHARRNQWLRSQVTRVALGLALLAFVAAGIALAAVRLLNRVVLPEVAEGGPPSTNEMANALCAKALMNLRGDNQRGLPEVYTNLNRAIDLDPNFAKPYVGLLEIHLRETMPGVRYPPTENLRTITQRLMELAPDSAAAHCGQSILNFFDWDYPSAEEHARRAVALGSEYELAHSFYGFMLTHWGRPEEARHKLEIARRLNPSKVQTHRVLGHTYYAERNFPRAVEVYRQAVGWEPHDRPSYIFMAYAYRAMGDYPKAIDVFEELESIDAGEKAKAGGRADRLRRAFAQDGARGYWEEEWNQTSTNRLYLRAVIQCQLGHTNAAFEILEQVYHTHARNGPVEDWMFYLLFDETWDASREEPRFRALLDKIGYTKVMPKQPIDRRAP
jgi:tetratricopeptide (TPR) repeat protein